MRASTWTAPRNFRLLRFAYRLERLFGVWAAHQPTAGAEVARVLRNNLRDKLLSFGDEPGVGITYALLLLVDIDELVEIE
jgi:hypothetical protein